MSDSILERISKPDGSVSVAALMEELINARACIAELEFRKEQLAVVAAANNSLRVARDDLIQEKERLEAAMDQAPIARVIVTEDATAAVILYAPGLPPGEFDVYLEPSTAKACEHGK